MPLWPFGRKKRRTSKSSHVTAAARPSTSTDEKAAGVLGPSPGQDVMTLSTPAQAHTQAQAPAQAQLPSGKDGQRKRKVLSKQDRSPAMTQQKHVQTLRAPNVQGITGLPALSALDASPHLRPAQSHKSVPVFHLDRASPNPATRLGYNPPISPSRQRSHDPKGREDEVRAMVSSPLQISKRPAGTNEILRRDSKKARRTFSVRRPDDQRGSNVSLPISIPSSMSAIPDSEQRGWAVGAMDLLSPRPTVRLSLPGFPPHGGSTPGLLRNDSKKGGKLPAIAQETSRRDRRKIADLADDLGSNDLRAVLERDRRRKAQKDLEQQNRLERRMRRRAEKQRAEGATNDDEREMERRGRDRAPPTAVHPAFRRQQPEVAAETGMLTPTSTHEEHDIHDSSARGTYLKYPARGDIPQSPFGDARPSPNPSDDQLAGPLSPGSDYYSPVQTPMEEPVVGTARAVRLSQGPMSPPTSPLAPPHEASGSLSEMSDMQPQSPDPTKVVDPPARRTRGWGAIFRRGESIRRSSGDHAGRSTPSEKSFANVSKESMARQAIPAHLVHQTSTRRSGAAVRTQSRFREDLPDAPTSPLEFHTQSPLESQFESQIESPGSRMQSPDPSVRTANIAAARRGKRSTQQSACDQSRGSGTHESPDLISLERTDSPVVYDGRNSDVVMSQSLASIDSEGSWISGRSPQRKSSARSTQRVQRDSAGSIDKQLEKFHGSYEKLPIPEHEYFSTLTSNANSRSADLGSSPAATLRGGEGSAAEDGTPVRRGTARRHPTVVHNDSRVRSREGLVAEYEAGATAPPTRAGSLGGRDSADSSPSESSYMHRARSISYGFGHAKSLSAGSAKLFEITPSKSGSRVASSTSRSPAIPQSEFQSS